MHIPKHLIVPLLAISITACQQNKAPKSVDTIAKADTTSTIDTIKTTDTVTANMPRDKAVPLAQLIVPGVSIGQTTINQSGEEVHRKLGTPDDGDSAMGKSVSIWYANHDTTGYVTQMYFSRGQGDDEIKRVKQIRVTSPFFKISNEVYAGTTFKSVRSAYKLKKVATFTDKGKTISLYDDSKGGIAFEVDEKDMIAGITVHEPGREATGTYLPFFPDLKYVK